MSRSTTIRPTPASIGSSALVLGVALLAGCSSYGPGNLQAGQSEADAIARMGQPSERTVLPGGGARLDFARGPMGAHTYRVELDASGRVRSIDQLLTEANFDIVKRDDSPQQVRDRLGPPSEARGGWRGLGEVWSYRYDWRVRCQWFQVWFVEQRVREAGYGIDPLCEEARKLSD
jgi:hypothetical protein